MKLCDSMPSVTELCWTLSLKIQLFACKFTWFHAQRYTFVLNLGHENKEIRLCDHVIPCPALHIGLEPWAWKQTNLLVKSYNSMPSITKLCWTLSMKLKKFAWKIMWFHAQYYRIVLNLGHENKERCLWNRTIPCLTLHNRVDPRAWNVDLF